MAQHTNVAGGGSTVEATRELGVAVDSVLAHLYVDRPRPDEIAAERWVST